MSNFFDSLFLGFLGQPSAKPFNEGRFRDVREFYGPHRAEFTNINPVYDNRLHGFLGFQGQRTVKPFDAGRFRDTWIPGDLFLGFRGQPAAKPFDEGRFRDFGESYRPYTTKFINIRPVPDRLYLGFRGQPRAKPFDVGTFRDILMPDDMFLGFLGQPSALPFDKGRFRDIGEYHRPHKIWLNDANDVIGRLFLAFWDQPWAKSFDVGIFWDFSTCHTTGRTALVNINPVYDSLFLGFRGQPAAKPFDEGRFRDFGESYRPYRTALVNINPVYDSLFLGFEGQPDAKPFDIGRFRDIYEFYNEGDTRRDVADISDREYGTRRIVLKPNPEPTPYIDHVERMRQHLIMQFQWDVIDGEIYYDKPVLRSILTGIGRELDDLDTAIFSLRRNRYLDTAQGKQLDGIGEIVGKDREAREAIALEFFGFYEQPNTTGFEGARFRDYDELALASYILADPEYRLALAQKIMMNVSGGTVEETIRSLKFIFNAPVIFLHECGNANIAVAIGRRLMPNEMLLANALDLIIRAAGVGLKFKSHFNFNHYFGFLGQLNSKSFEVGSFADTFYEDSVTRIYRFGFYGQINVVGFGRGSFSDVIF